MTARRPPLKYFGGKHRIAHKILPYFPKHRIYIEPFGGGGALLLHKEPAYIEVYNDVDGDVVNLFRVLRNKDQAAELISLLVNTPMARDEFMAAYEETEDPVERARRLVVISFQSIGAKGAKDANGWRARTAQSKWSPCNAWNTYPEALYRTVARLKDVMIENLDFRRILEIYDSPEALFYVDPPYPKGTRSKGDDIYAHELTDGDHADLLARLVKMDAYVVLSGYQSEMYDSALKGWKQVLIAARAQTNAPRTEVLYLSPRTAESVTLPLL